MLDTRRTVHRLGSWPTTGMGLLRIEFSCRVALAAVFVVVAHQFSWTWLRFVTSDVILRLSSSLGMATARVSFDTVRIQGELFQFVIACTFVDVFAGSVPLLWRRKRSHAENGVRLIAAAAVLFTFNVVRLEIGQMLYSRGILPYALADDVFGGFAYFTVWLYISRSLSREFVKPLTS
jgi:hypothetical protein